MKAQEEDSHLQAQEGDLRRNQSFPHLVLQLLASRDHTFLLYKSPILWHVVIAVLANLAKSAPARTFTIDREWEAPRKARRGKFSGDKRARVASQIPGTVAWTIE